MNALTPQEARTSNVMVEGTISIIGACCPSIVWPWCHTLFCFFSICI